MFNKKNNIVENIYSFLLAVIIMSELLITPIIYVFNVTSGANLIIIIIEFLLICLGLLFEREKIKIHPVTFIMFILLTGSVLLSIAMNSVKYSFIQMIFYFMIPFYAATKKISFEKVLRYCLYLSLPSILCLSSIFTYQYDQFNQISMGNSYAVSISCIAFLFHVFFYRKKINIVVFISYMLNIYFIYKLILTSTRGAILSIFVAVFLILIIKIKVKGEYDAKIKEMIYTKKTRIDFSWWSVVLVGLLAVSIIAVFNYSYIISSLREWFINKNEPVPSFIYKMNMFLQDNDMGNGRNELYNEAFSLISQRLVFGYGVETFSQYTPYPWPHNVFIQFWFEYGVIIGSLLSVPIIVAIYISVFKKKIEPSFLIFSNFLLVLAVPRYFVSNDVWTGVHIWLLYGFILVYIDSLINKGKGNAKNNLYCL